MPFDISRVVAGCIGDILHKLIVSRAPDKAAKIDWTLSDRSLSREIDRLFSSDGRVWPLLQQIESLAVHGGRPLVRSVLINNRSLRDAFDDLDASDETAAAWLAFTSEEYFEFALSALHADQGLNKRSWRAFTAPFSDEVKFDFSPAAKEKFERSVREAIEKARYLDKPGRLNVHQFKRVVFPEHSHGRREQIQVTVYAEMRNITEDVFTEDNQIETRRRKKIDQISVVLDRARRELDVVTIGGKDFIRSVAHAFCESFSSEIPAIEDLIRRPVKLELLARRPALPLEGQTLVKTAKVDEIRVRSPSGWLFTFERKSREQLAEDVYDVAEEEFGDRSPFSNPGWKVESARIRLEMEPTTVGRTQKIRTVELKPNGRTNLREHQDQDRWIANELLVSWGILEPGRDEPE